MLIPYNYLPFEFKNTKPIFKEWKKLIKSTDFTLGKKMIDFEKKFLSIQIRVEKNNAKALFKSSMAIL